MIFAAIHALTSSTVCERPSPACTLSYCDGKYAHQVTTACHLGNIALRVGRKIQWDAEREQVIGDEEANTLVRREYRPPWELPGV